MDEGPLCKLQTSNNSDVQKMGQTQTHAYANIIDMEVVRVGGHNCLYFDVQPLVSLHVTDSPPPPHIVVMLVVTM